MATASTTNNAPNGPATSFPKFGLLPTEIRDEIWEFAATNNGQGHIIDVCFEGRSFYQQVWWMQPIGGVLCNYRMFEVQQPGTLLACTESRKRTLRKKTHYLRLNGGYKIFFDPSIDTIFFDTMDFFRLHEYATDLIRNNMPMNLHGFEAITHLATNRDGNFDLLRDLRTDPRCGPILSNVVDPVQSVQRRVSTILEVEAQLYAEYTRMTANLNSAPQRRVLLCRYHSKMARAYDLFSPL